MEVDRHCIATAYDNSNALSRLRTISARKQRGEGRGSAWLRNYSQNIPECFLRFSNLSVCNQHDAADVFFRNRKHQLTHATRGERVRRDSPGFSIYGLPGLECSKERRRGLRFNADDFDFACIPCGYPADQPATTDGDKQSVDPGDLFLNLHAERPLTEQGLRLIECMHRQCSRANSPFLAGSERIRIKVTCHDQVCPIAAYPLQLCRRCYLGNEDFRRNAELHRGIGDGYSMIAS